MTAAVDLVVSEFVVLSIACFFVLRYYAAALISYDVLITVYLSWVLGLAGVMFLPYDLSVALVENDHSPALERVWRFVYWSTFILAWVILPIQMEFHGSGHFTFKEKFWDALYRLVIAGVVAIVAAFIYIIYLASTSGGSFSEVIGFVMAMGNTYGVLLLTLLMGNGLVALPMHLWKLGDIDRGLRELYMSAAYTEEAFQDARYEMEDCELEVEKIIGILDKSGSAALRNEVGPLVAVLKDKVSNFQFGPRSKSRSFMRGFQVEQVDDRVLVSPPHLIKLHARLMTAQIKARAAERRWNVLLAECERQEMVSAARASLSQAGWCSVSTAPAADPTNASAGSGSAGGAATAPFSVLNPWTWSAPSWLQPYVRNLYLLWAQRLYTHSCRGAAVVCGLMSLLILWCEMLMSSHVDSPIGLLMTAYDYQQSSSVMVQAVSFVVLMYMSICTYWPLFRLNIGWAYQLQGPQQSSPFSLIFNAEYLSRLQFTIGYNFLMFLNVPKASNTAFNQMMKNIELIPVFGTSFAVYIPLIMILMALLTLFDGYGRLVKVLGIEWEDTTSQYDGITCSCSNSQDQAAALDPAVQERIRTGKLVVANELKQRRAAVELNVTSSGVGTGRSVGGTGTLSPTASQKSLQRLESGGGGGKAYTNQNKMRIGGSDTSKLTNITEALIPNIPRYRNLSDQDTDFELSDPYGRSVGNPLSSNAGGRAAARDLFSIDDDSSGGAYGGRYANV